MPRIVLSKTYQHEQIEFPEGTPHPEGRRGGGKSSLHLRRNKVRDVTDAELEHIRLALPKLYACLEILPEPKPLPAKKPKKEAKAPEAKSARKRSRKTGGGDKPAEG